MDIQKIINILEDLVYEDINNEEYWKAIKDAKALIKELKQALTIPTVVGRSEQADVSVCSRCKKNPKHKESIYCIDCLYERKMSGY